MWISKIELSNFKSYQHQVFEFPPPTKGRNIVLIGGMNGYGKTSVLEALYLGLYGKEAIDHLGRAGLKDAVGYRKFVEKSWHGAAIRMKRDSMWIKIQINQSVTEGLEVTRTWFFSRSGDWIDNDEVVIYEVRNGIRGRALQAERLPELLDRQFIPVHFAPFFFFDGEEVKKLADQSRGEQIRSGLEGLLGVTLLRDLKKRLEQFQANRSSGVAVMDEEKHRQLFESLSKHETEYAETEHRSRDLTTKVKALREQRADLMSRMMALGAGAGDVASAADIIKQQADAETELKNTEDALDSLIASKLPFHLVSDDLMKELSRQVREEVARDSWEARKLSLEPEKAKFIDAFYATEEPPVTPSLTAEQQLALQARLNAAWESLFYPMPAGCADVVVHEYLGGKRPLLLERMGQLRVGAQDVLGLVEKKESLEKRIRDLSSRYTKLEGVDRDGSLAKLNEELVGVNASLDQRQTELGDTDRLLSSLGGTLDLERKLYAREHEKFVHANPVKSMVGRADRVCNLIEELIPQLYSLKVKQLAEAMTEVYSKLAHKSQVQRIEIDESCTTSLLDREGNEIPFDKSAGENQVFATALLAGLAKISGIDAPLVVNTPLGRLDNTHRSNILRYWVSDGQRQVVLLSQDKEIDVETFKSIEPSVAKTYLLHHVDIGNGVGRTTATEGHYFKEVA